MPLVASAMDLKGISLYLERDKGSRGAYVRPFQLEPVNGSGPGALDTVYNSMQGPDSHEVVLQLGH